jgi:uncharacterized low-complexity protein
MSEKKAAKPVALAVGAALAGTLAFGATAQAETGASPFAMTSLSTGYMLGLGEGSCGGDKEGTKDEAEGSCGEGSCGGDKAKDAEASCGGDKDDAKEEAEGSCGDDSQTS